MLNSPIIKIRTEILLSLEPKAIPAPAEYRAIVYFDSLLHRGISHRPFLTGDSILCDSLQSLLWALPDMRDVATDDIHHRQAARHLLAKAYLASQCWHKAEIQATLLISYSNLSLITHSRFKHPEPENGYASNPVWDLFDAQSMIMNENIERIGLIHIELWPELNMDGYDSNTFANLRKVKGVNDDSDIRYKLGSDTDPLYYKRRAGSDTDLTYMFRLRSDTRGGKRPQPDPYPRQLLRNDTRRHPPRHPGGTHTRTCRRAYASNFLIIEYMAIDALDATLSECLVPY